MATLTPEQKQFVLQGGVISGQDPETQQAYADFVRANQAGSSITGADLTPSTSLDFEKPATAPASPVIVPEKPAPLGPKQQGESDLSKQIQRLQEEIGGVGELVGKEELEIQKREQFGVEAKIATQQSIFKQLQNLKAFTENIPAQIQAESVARGRTAGGIAPLEIGRLRQAGIQANILNAQYSAATGDLATAERQVKQAVNDVFAPKEAELAALKANQESLKDSSAYKGEVKARLDAAEVKRKADEAKVAAAKSVYEDIIKLTTKIMESSVQDGQNSLIANQITDLVNTEEERLGANVDVFAKAQALASRYLAKQPTTGTLSDFEAAFQRQHGRLPTVDELTAFKRSTQTTFLTATGAIDRVLTPAEQQLYGSPAGTKLSEIQGQVPISPTQREKLTSFTQALPIVQAIKDMAGQLDLADTISGTILRGTKLKARSFLPATAEGQYEAQKRSFLTLLSRAAGERGVVTDQDVNRIAGNIPGFYDTKKSAQLKLERFADILKEVQARAAAGYIGDPLNQSSPTNQLDPLGLF